MVQDISVSIFDKEHASQVKSIRYIVSCTVARSVVISFVFFSWIINEFFEVFGDLFVV